MMITGSITLLSWDKRERKKKKKREKKREREGYDGGRRGEERK